MGRVEVDNDYSNEGFAFNHYINKSWVMDNFHFHDLFEVYYSLTDNVKYFVKDKIYTMEKGDMLVFNNMDMHKCIVPSDVIYERYVILFNPRYINSLCTQNTDLLECYIEREENFSHFRHLTQDQSKAMLDLLKRMDFYNKSNEYGKDVLLKSMFAEMLVMVNSIYQPDVMLHRFSHGWKHDKIKPILQYITANLSENLTIDHLAKTFFISKYYICFLFKKTAGFTVNEYIINSRINKARGLLKKNMLVSQVSEAVGFRHVTHFSSTFKKLVGVSPKQYAEK